MREQLKIHTDSVCRAVHSITVDVSRPGAGTLELRYIVSGAISDLVVPEPTVPARVDGLWRHTCFEAFVRTAGEKPYCEFNFAPSGEWAAYRFGDHRDGMKVAEELPAPAIGFDATSSSLELAVTLELGQLAEISKTSAWRLSISAVIEERSGRKSYWALAHPPGPADFHHGDGFRLELSFGDRARP
ncbi:MAG: DOMON-like domain-containing protein [Alphaproteobacteria bacterium]|nr:DOMON-like domain-containing protein [Alphaproteobacteria bacterium]